LPPTHCASSSTHETVGDPHAPWAQVLFPPPGQCQHPDDSPGLGGALAEVRRGFQVSARMWSPGSPHRPYARM
jgi:hypothetical protein